MASENRCAVEHQIPLSRLMLAWNIVVRSTAIGLIFSGVGWMILRPPVIVGLGLGLGNGLLLSALTCLCFYPLKQFGLYRWLVKFISAFIAGGGVAINIVWQYSSTSMTPSSAVLIGLGSVIAAVIAGLIGALVGENIARWYKQKTHAIEEAAIQQTLNLTKTNHFLELVLPPRELDGIQVTLLSLAIIFLGYPYLNSLVCDGMDAFECLPSPRLFTSQIAGLKIVLPLIFMVILLQSQYRVSLRIDRHRLYFIQELFRYRFRTHLKQRQNIRCVHLTQSNLGTHLNVAIQIGEENYEIGNRLFTTSEAHWLADELSDWLQVPLETTRRETRTIRRV